MNRTVTINKEAPDFGAFYLKTKFSLNQYINL